MTEKPYLLVEGIAKSFNGTMWTPAPITFRLDGGSQIVVINGDNGSGKTTLLKILTGEEMQTCGTFDWAFSNPFSVLYQSDGILPHTSVANNLRIVSSSIDAITSALGDVGLSVDSFHRNADTLSGGEERRLQLARCILSERRCWIFDEPTSHSDATFRELLLRRLTDHVKEGGYAIIVTHDGEFRRELNGVLDEPTSVATIRLCRNGD